MNRGLDFGKFYSYGILARDIPEISGLLKYYGTSMITFGMNDFYNRLHTPGGASGAKYSIMHIEAILGGFISNEEPLEILLDYNLSYWEFVMAHYLHEFIHTVEMQIEIYTDNFMDLHSVIHYLGYENMEIKKAFILNFMIVDEKYIGIPPSFWKEWHNNNPRITI